MWQAGELAGLTKLAGLTLEDHIDLDHDNNNEAALDFVPSIPQTPSARARSVIV